MSLDRDEFPPFDFKTCDAFWVGHAIRTLSKQRVLQNKCICLVRKARGTK